MRIIFFLSLATVLLFSQSLNAQTCATDPERCAFVSTSGTARRVVSVNPSTATITTIRSYASSTVLRDVTVAPDHRPNCAGPGNTCAARLYVAVDNRIERMTLDGAGATEVYSPKPGCGSQPTAPSGVRINHAGDLLFNSADGVWQVTGAQAGACAVRVPGTSGAGAGLAFQNNGNLLLSVNGEVRRAALGAGTYQSATALPVPIALGGSVVGIAGDSSNRILVAAGNSISRFGPDGEPDLTFSVSFGTLQPIYIEVRLDPAEYLYVSVADSGGENGRVYQVSESGATTLIATLPRVRGSFLGAVGLGLHPGRRQLSHAFESLSESHSFDFGYSRFEISGDQVAHLCSVNVTAIAEQPQVLNDVFNDSGLSVVTIPQSGQQGFGTRYQVDSAPSGCLGEVRTRWSGYFDPALYAQPGMARIPEACAGPSPCAQVLQTFYFSPTGPLPGDPIIINRTLTSGFVPVAVALTNHFTFGGWLAPTGTNPPIVVNAGQTAVFKFQLLSSNGTLISDAQAGTVTTVFSIAKVPFAEEEALFPGNSIQVPPRFSYDTRDDQFRYTLDTSGLSSGRYRAIVASNSFAWETLEFCVNSCN